MKGIFSIYILADYAIIRICIRLLVYASGKNKTIIRNLIYFAQFKSSSEEYRLIHVLYYYTGNALNAQNFLLLII
jgi:hypothetical protein